jgi:DNA-binding XRE family transcriptional regulator
MHLKDLQDALRKRPFTPLRLFLTDGATFDVFQPELCVPGRRSVFIGILRARRKLGLSQAELARRAGIRPETLNRIEQGRNKPSVPTIAKIDRALQAAEAAERKR